MFPSSIGNRQACLADPAASAAKAGSAIGKCGHGPRLDFVVFSDDWGRHPSSCQHLFTRLARRHRVVWVNTIGLRSPRADRFTFVRGLEKLGQWTRPLRQISPNFWVYSPWMLPAAGGWMGQLNSRLVAVCLRRVLARCGLESPVLFASVPTAADYVGHLGERAVAYYITDDYRQWPGADAEHVAAQDRLLTERADLLLPCGQALAQGRQAHGRVELLPHAVDLEHFAAADLPAEEPADLASIPHPRLGFFGLIYEKIDLPLLARLARSNPDRHLVLIGPVKTDVSALAALPNVHLLGAKPYAELPRYLHGLDVLLLAYVLDGQTTRNAPLKIRECLAAGKPIVAKAIADLEGFRGLIHLARTDVDFLAACNEACTNGRGDAAAMRAAVAGQTWEARARQVEEALVQVLAHESQPASELREQQVARPTQLANVAQPTPLPRRERVAAQRPGEGDNSAQAMSGHVRTPTGPEGPPPPSRGRDLEAPTQADWDGYVASHAEGSIWHRFAWTATMRGCYGMRCWNLTVQRDGRLAGILPLALQKSQLFGRHLVSLPWLDYAGILADDDAAASELAESAMALARRLQADLTLRQLAPTAALAGTLRLDKVAMVLDLPQTPEQLWDGFCAKVRNQVRKAQKSQLAATWADAAALDEFFTIYSTNMRDLGSPPHSRDFFAAVLRELADVARLLIIHHEDSPAAAALVLADPRGWQVPWASSLRDLNHLCPNHLLYWTILESACGQTQRFCFGRSTQGSGTYKFKAQWGAQAVPLAWQTWPPRAQQVGSQDGRLVQLAQKAWQRLPVWVARLLGPQLIKAVG